MNDGVKDLFSADCIALFLDIDGTLLEFAPSPQSVIVPDGLISSLARTESALAGALALVSGRTIDDLDRLFQPLRLRASGAHGAEIRFKPTDATGLTREIGELPTWLWRKLVADLAAFPGAFAENKRFSFAVHCRAAPRLAPRLRESLWRLVCEEEALDLELLQGRLAFEIKARGFDKGVAILDFMERAPFAGRTPIFIGDDATDEFGFAAVVMLQGTAYSVGRTRPTVTATFPDPQAVREWLEGLTGQQVQT